MRIAAIKKLFVFIAGAFVSAVPLLIARYYLDQRQIGFDHFLKLFLFSLGILAFAILFDGFILKPGLQIGLLATIILSFTFIPIFQTSNLINALVFCVWLALTLTDFQYYDERRRNFIKKVFRWSNALFAGCIVPTMYTGILIRFSEEEFYLFAQAGLLCVYWMTLKILLSAQKPRLSSTSLSHTQYLAAKIKTGTLLALNITLSLVGIHSYQNSFYSKTAPSYAPITEDRPFLCGTAQRSDQTYPAEQIYARFVRLVSSKPTKDIRDLGFLSLTTQDPSWARSFRLALLDEASHKLYTKPANSVKYGQYLASHRVYYYATIKERYSDLFDKNEEEIIQNWFADINRRALTVEWVDVAYALAFGFFPKGTYENQESGAGLIALLEHFGLSAPELHEKNLEYLTNIRGWEWRFRNSDDAIVYQGEWLDNAYYQSLYAPVSEKGLENLQKSFKWLLLQANPSGGPLVYNHIGGETFAAISLLGAHLTREPEFLWIAARSLDFLEKNNLYPTPHPGNEYPSQGVGTSPIEGSCLIFGDSGLPTEKGPLAPDKVVFRSGWDEGDLYMLLNLRFSGWHGYKASNSIIVVNNGSDLLVEDLSAHPIKWLPTGRSLFRDKRIPRENLNGMVLEKTGLPMVLYQITGLGSPWAQDVPQYASVVRFETNDLYDLSTTVIENWHGWTHWRTIYFYRRGFAVIIDHVEGNSPIKKAFSFHLFNVIEDNALRYRTQGDFASQIIFVPLTENLDILSTVRQSDDLTSVLFEADKNTPKLSLITVILGYEARHASITIQKESLSIQLKGERIEIPFETFKAR